MRKLAIASASFSAAIFASVYILKIEYLIPLAAVLAIIAAGLVFLCPKKLRRTKIILISALIGLCYYRVNYQLRIIPAQGFIGQRTVTAEVMDFVKDGDGYSSVEMKLTSREGPHLKFNLYDYSDRLSGLEPGAQVSITAKFSFADTKYGDESLYYFSNGVFLKATLKAQPEILRAGGLSLRNFLHYLNRAFVLRAQSIFSADTSPFMQSLMLGDKSELYKDTALYTSMCRAGIMHTVAVSGMHIAFLVAFLKGVFGMGRSSISLYILVIWLFVMMTGANPSAVRAGIMQTLILIAPLLRRNHDDITSLTFALAAILAFNPYSAASVGLQLSFASMLGIVLINEPLFFSMYDVFSREERGRFTAGMISLVSASFSSMALAVPVMAVYFGYVSALSPLVCVLTMWAVSLCFGGGYVSCLLSMLWEPLGKAAAWIIAWPVRFIRLVVRGISSLPFCCLYTDNRAVLIWLIASYALLAGAIVLKKAGKFRVFVSMGLSALLLAVAVLFAYRTNPYIEGQIAVLDVGQGQCIVISAGDNAVMVDCGNIFSDKNAALIADDYMFNNGIDRLDALILTHFHEDHCGNVDALMEMKKVDVLYSPEYEDDALARQIADNVQSYGTELCSITGFTERHYGDMRVRLYPPRSDKNTNENCLFVLVSIGNYDILITGDNPKSAEEAFIEKYPLPQVETVVVGHHGSRYSSGEDYLRALDADNAVISVGYNTYGHPTYETLQRLISCGYNVYRTDLNGTVTITVGKDYGG